MTSNGSGLDAFELLIWVTLIPLFVVLVGSALRRGKDDEGAAPGAADEERPRDGSDQATHE